MTHSKIVALASRLNPNAPSTPVVVESGRRRRRSAQERAALLARFADSGQSAAAFCRAAGLCAVTFSGWRRRQAPDVAKVPATKAARFAAVQLASEAAALPGPDAPCLVQLPNGIRIAVTSQVDPAWLAAVLSHVR